MQAALNFIAPGDYCVVKWPIIFFFSNHRSSYNLWCKREAVPRLGMVCLSEPIPVVIIRFTKLVLTFGVPMASSWSRIDHLDVVA